MLKFMIQGNGSEHWLNCYDTGSGVLTERKVQNRKEQKMITTISAIGRLGNDPEQKVSLKGTEYILFDLAVDRGFGDRKETD